MQRCDVTAAPFVAAAAFAAVALLAALGLGGCVSLTPYAEVRAALPPGALLPVDGAQVYVEDRAAAASETTAGAGEPVLFLHGFGASSHSWRHVLERLPDRRVIALDLRGFGYTERPRGVDPYTREGQVEMVLAVLDHLDLERVHLVGHSYGGSLALTFAHRHPRRLRSLALVSPAHPEYPRRRRRGVARVRPLLALFLRAYALRPSTVRRALHASVADDSLVTPELVRAYLERLRVEGAVTAYRGLTVPLPERGSPAVELSEITLPTLVVWGEEDRLITAADGRDAVAPLPCHRFVTLPGVGHLPMEESPAALAAELRRFLARPGHACGE